MNNQQQPAPAPVMPAALQAAYEALPRLPTGLLNLALFTDTNQMELMSWTNVSNAIHQHTIQQLHDQLVAQQATIQQQQGQIQAFQNFQLPQPIVNVAAPAAPAHSTAKVPKPQPFKGDRASSKAFIQSLVIYFSMRPYAEFVNPQAKIKYTLLLCEDRAAVWAQPIMDEILHPPHDSIRTCDQLANVQGRLQP